MPFSISKDINQYSSVPKASITTAMYSSNPGLTPDSVMPYSITTSTGPSPTYMRWLRPGTTVADNPTARDMHLIMDGLPMRYDFGPDALMTEIVAAQASLGLAGRTFIWFNEIQSPLIPETACCGDGYRSVFGSVEQCGSQTLS
jgi:hypothetical protein